MKIICKQSELLASTNVALRAVSSKTTMTILECLLFEAFDGKIFITSNNMELGIKTELGGRIDMEGRVAIEAKLFSEIVRKLPDDMVIIETDENYTVYITCGKAKFKLAAQSGDDYPVLPEVEKSEYVSISEYSLKEIINQTIFAISDNENTRIMTGEHFEIIGNTLTVTALDGHRIAIRKIEMKGSYDPHNVVIPGKTLIEISKILENDTEKMVTVFFSTNIILFVIGNTYVVSRLIEGKYINVKQMISEDYDIKVKVQKRDFMECIDRATLLVKESDKKPVIIEIRDDAMSLSMNTSLGSLDEDIAINKEGKDIMIGFNPKFLLDVIKVIDDDEITMYMTNSKAPCFIRDEKGSYNYLVLPVNFSGR